MADGRLSSPRSQFALIEAPLKHTAAALTAPLSPAPLPSSEIRPTVHWSTKCWKTDPRIFSLKTNTHAYKNPNTHTQRERVKVAAALRPQTKFVPNWYEVQNKTEQGLKVGSGVNRDSRKRREQHLEKGREGEEKGCVGGSV